MNKFQQWWLKPVTLKDRLSGAFIGTITFFWLALFFAFLTALKFGQVDFWLQLSLFVSIGTLAGYIKPKIMKLVGFPFIFLGFSK